MFHVSQFKNEWRATYLRPPDRDELLLVELLLLEELLREDELLLLRDELPEDLELPEERELPTLGELLREPPTLPPLRDEPLLREELPVFQLGELVRVPLERLAFPLLLLAREPLLLDDDDPEPRLAMLFRPPCVCARLRAVMLGASLDAVADGERLEEVVGMSVLSASRTGVLVRGDVRVALSSLGRVVIMLTAWSSRPAASAIGRVTPLPVVAVGRSPFCGLTSPEATPEVGRSPF